MTEWLNATSEWVIYLLTILFIGGGMEAGAVLARRRRDRPTSDGDRFLSALAAPSIGLLALMIGFTFSMALSRFEARKAVLLSEANAIGTAALRGQMLQEPYRSAVAPLFLEYTKIRVGTRGQLLESSATEQATRRSLEIQEELWRAGMDAAAANPQVVPSGLFIQALNTLIDVHEERLTAARNQVPSVIFVALEGIAIVAFGFAGYGLQLANVGCRKAMWIMAMMMGSVIMLVLDLDRPQAGLIMVDQRPLLDLINGKR
jgi:hypothetical protein